MIADLPYLALALLAFAVPTSITLWLDPHVRAAGARRWRR